MASSRQAAKHFGLNDFPPNNHHCTYPLGWGTQRDLCFIRWKLVSGCGIFMCSDVEDRKVLLFVTWILVMSCRRLSRHLFSVRCTLWWKLKTVLLMLSVGWSLGTRMKAHHWGMRHTRCLFRTEGCRKPVFCTKIFVLVPGAQSYNSFPYNPTHLSYKWMGPGSLVIV